MVGHRVSRDVGFCDDTSAAFRVFGRYLAIVKVSAVNIRLHEVWCLTLCGSCKNQSYGGT
jgi:hypothetical protein